MDPTTERRLAAERYSAGVTLCEMTLGHDQLPKWGEENVADPAVTDDELVLVATGVPQRQA